MSSLRGNISEILQKFLNREVLAMPYNHKIDSAEPKF